MRTLLIVLMLTSVAHAGSPEAPPNAHTNMALIPAGVNEGTDPDFGAYSLTNETAFYMGVYEVTWSFWDTVRQWGRTNGYTDLPAGRTRMDCANNAIPNIYPNEPVTFVKWYDCVKWCNARSEMEGLKPCYYTTSAQATVYRTGSLKLQDNTVNWTANGYRLPTEWEWEYAARGGLSGKRYPWGDEIDGSKANYIDSGDPYENGRVDGKVDMVNGYGLYSMAGNVWEWTWSFWFGTHGPRVIRGGTWYYRYFTCRCGYRNAVFNRNGNHCGIGFRCVRGL